MATLQPNIVSNGATQPSDDEGSTNSGTESDEHQPNSESDTVAFPDIRIAHLLVQGIGINHPQDHPAGSTIEPNTELVIAEEFHNHYDPNCLRLNHSLTGESVCFVRVSVDQGRIAALLRQLTERGLTRISATYLGPVIGQEQYRARLRINFYANPEDAPEAVENLSLIFANAGSRFVAA